MEKHSIFIKTKSLFAKLPLKIWILGGALLILVLAYSLLFFIPKTVHFSYAEKSCIGQFVVAPNIQKVSSDNFDITFTNEVRLGNITLFSTKACFTPKHTTTEGTQTASIAPFGGIIARKYFTIDVPKTPIARADDVIGKTISTAEPLKIGLTSADIIHTYTLNIANKIAKCTQNNSILSCDLTQLKLEQGASYTVALHRQYNRQDETLLEGKIDTLRPLVFSDASIKDGRVVYDTPTEATFTFDHSVKSAEVKLTKVTSDKTEVIPTTIENGTQLKVKFKDLARETKYQLVVTQAVGDNGSSLAQPLTINFTTSGGPKVANVSVGANSVARTATILVSFDQPIDATADITKFAHVEGLNATIRKTSDTQISFAIQGGDCTGFTLVVDKGLKSGANNETSKDAWRYSSRTICGTSWVIGNSVKGRSIVAYSFGSGSKTILFTGGMHGSERSGQQTMQAWAEYLQANGNIIPTDKRVVIVPNTNPDGIAANTRNNSNNVNIDRNFPTANWQSSIETSSGTLANGGGTAAASEPETAALIALTRQLRPRLEVSFHSQGRLVGANKYSDSVAIGNIYAGIVGYQTMFTNAEEVMGYTMTGEYEDWMGEELGAPAILVELPSPSGNYLSTQMKALLRMLAV